MKGNGLSSTSRTLLKKVTKQNVFVGNQEGFLAGKEKQKSLFLQAAKAQADRQKRELERQAALAAALTPSES